MRLDTGPAIMAPMKEPPARAAPMPPWVVPDGLLKYSTYWFVPMMAEMEEMSKPKLASMSKEFYKIWEYGQLTACRQPWR